MHTWSEASKNIFCCVCSTGTYSGSWRQRLLCSTLLSELECLPTTHSTRWQHRMTLQDDIGNAGDGEKTQWIMLGDMDNFGDVDNNDRWRCQMTRLVIVTTPVDTDGCNGQCWWCWQRWWWQQCWMTLPFLVMVRMKDDNFKLQCWITLLVDIGNAGDDDNIGWQRWLTTLDDIDNTGDSDDEGQQC